MDASRTGFPRGKEICRGVFEVPPGDFLTAVCFRRSGAVIYLFPRQIAVMQSASAAPQLPLAVCKSPGRGVNAASPPRTRDAGASAVISNMSSSD